MCLTYIVSLFFISVISSIGMSIVFVEKRYDFPIRKLNIIFRRKIRKINPKLSTLGLCTVCFSFWAALLSDIFLLVYSNFSYFLWPLTGFASSGIVWLIISYLNIIDNGDQ
ncbi:hypothetical protein CMI47_18295 [Candidatus Pacearchaeota archaeon]|nr:hypothetical protein [Candidatus Pacearchaeota archaeon]